MSYISNYNKTSTRGFTLVEVIISMTILTMVIGGLLSFNFQIIKGGIYATDKIEINSKIRKITSELSDVSKESNYFVLYNSFSTTDHDAAEDRLSSGFSGDFAVFVYVEENALSFGTNKVTRIVGYYRKDETTEGLSNVGPITKFDKSYETPVDISSTGSTTLEELILTASSSLSEEIVEITAGLANGDLFYNYDKKSIMINAQIYHGNARKRVTDTYNFTVSPRG